MDILVLQFISSTEEQGLSLGWKETKLRAQGVKHLSQITLKHWLSE
jgi:hypothetical protein